MAVEFGIDVKTVKKRVASAVPVHTTHNGTRKLYLLKDVARQVLGLRDDYGSNDEVLDPQQENARLNLARREKVEFETAVLRGEYLRADDVEALLYEMVTNCKTKILGMPSKYTHLILASDDHAEAVDIFDSSCREALEELSFESLPESQVDTKSSEQEGVGSAA